MNLRVTGHKVTYTHHGPRGDWSAACTCGWDTYGPSRKVMQEAYHNHKREAMIRAHDR